MALLIKTYLWFLGVPFGLIWTWIVWRSLMAKTESGSADRASAVSFTWVFGGLFTIPYFLLAVIQVMGGYEGADYVSKFAVHEPYALAGWVVQISIFPFVICWIWISSAANVVVILAERPKRLSSEVAGVKWVITAFSVVGIGALLFRLFR